MQAKRSRHADEHGEVRWIPMTDGLSKKVLDREVYVGILDYYERIVPSLQEATNSNNR